MAKDLWFSLVKHKEKKGDLIVLQTMVNYILKNNSLNMLKNKAYSVSFCQCM